MKVAVITPYYQTPAEWVAQCVESVRSQSHPCTHIVVCDGDPSFPPSLHHPGLQLHGLAVSHHDYGDTPRAIGSISAFRQGFDAVAWLDADNWYKPNHVASLVELATTRPASVYTSTRDICHLDGWYMGPCPEMASGALIDTNCFFVPAAAREMVTMLWSMPDEQHKFGDRFLFTELQRRRAVIAHTTQSTVCYRTNFKRHYEIFGYEPPPGARASYRLMRESSETNS